MTRTEDISLHDDDAKTIKSKKTSDLHNRMKIMNETPNAVFVSIHQNFYTSASSRGTQVFYSPATHDDSQALARSIQSSVVNELQPENKRQIKESTNAIYLLYAASKPAVMVECGFLSNPNECEKLCDEQYQTMLASSIASGISEYIINK